MTATWKYCGDELTDSPNGFAIFTDANGDQFSAYAGIKFGAIGLTSEVKDVSVA